jgi:DNA-binding NarL/FixJ family response regulator
VSSDRYERSDQAHPHRSAESAHSPHHRPDGGGGTIRVLLADDHRILRTGLAGLLHGQPDIEVVAEASDGQMALELTRQLEPDVVIMDVNMPKLNGIAATHHITAEMPHVRVIVLSFYEDEGMASAMREAGAAAYLTKDGDVEDLLAAIRQARPSHTA